MAITLNGSGTVTGVSDLPTAVTATDLTATDLDVSGDFAFDNGYGSVAPVYGCRAWVNFNGTGTVAIRDSGNVSSITDNGTGSYTVNFTTSMPDANYSCSGIAQAIGVANLFVCGPLVAPSTTSVNIATKNYSNASVDGDYVSFQAFR